MNAIRALRWSVLVAFVFPLTSFACNEAAQKYIDLGATAYQNRMDLAQAKSALDLFDKAVAANPACLDALVKGSRAAWWVADHSKSRDEKIRTFQKGMDWGKAAIALDPRSADAHFWLAGNMGSYGETRGVLKSLFLVKPIRRELEEILKIDPGYDHGAALRVLGVVDYKVPGFAGGNKKRALERLSKALAMGPQVGFNQFDIAEYYATMGDKEKALEHLLILRGLTATGDDQPDLLDQQEKGRALESRLTGKSS